MTGLDRAIQSWRIREAMKRIPEGARILDVGSHDGALFRALDSRLGEGLGVDPELDVEVRGSHWKLVPGLFPEDVDGSRRFDVITMLAVLEHVPPDQHEQWSAACTRLLAESGRLIITVPSPAVDHILAVLVRLRLVHGMSLEQHYGYEPDDTPEVFSGLKLIEDRRFQFGLNRIFVFEKM